MTTNTLSTTNRKELATALLTTILVGFIPTWIYLFIWNQTSPHDHHTVVLRIIESVLTIVYGALQVAVWLFVCLFWDGPSETDRQMCRALERGAVPLGICFVVALLVLEYRIWIH